MSATLEKVLEQLNEVNSKLAKDPDNTELLAEKTNLVKQLNKANEVLEESKVLKG